VKDIHKLLLLARRLRKRIAHLYPQFVNSWYCVMLCKPRFRTSKLMLEMTTFDCVVLLRALKNRLKLVQAEIRRRARGQ